MDKQTDRQTYRQTDRQTGPHIEFTMAATEVLNEILQSVQNSQLNFSINLTPFSAYITIRNTFVKNYSPPATIPQLVPQTSVKLEADNKVLLEKNEELGQQMENLDETNKASSNTVKILEDGLPWSPTPKPLTLTRVPF